MPEIKPRRGRPKGSGIDDRSRLRQLASLLRDKPDLKPTTAIRALGIKDPSAIRRLRDNVGKDVRVRGCLASGNSNPPG